MTEYRCRKRAGYVADAAILSGRDVTGMFLSRRP